MEIGVPQSLYTTVGAVEFVFNDFTLSPTQLSGIATTVYPSGVSAGSGVLIQQITNDPAVRVAVDNLAHKSGGLAHKFYRGPRYITLEAIVLGNSPADRATLNDQLAATFQQVMQDDGWYLWTPTSTGQTRFYKVRHYEALKVQHSTSTTGAVQGVSSPKTMLITLVAADWLGYTYSASTGTISAGSTVTVPNAGNTTSYPIFNLQGPASSTVTITNNDTGAALTFADPTLLGGNFIEIDMRQETATYNILGSLSNALFLLDMTTSDFFGIAPGGNSITVTGADFTYSANDAWA